MCDENDKTILYAVYLGQYVDHEDGFYPVPKIGNTTNLTQRMKSLYSTSVLHRPELIRAVSLPKRVKPESRFHAMFNNSRVKEDREFFDLDEDAIHAFFDLMVDLGCEEIYIEDPAEITDDAEVIEAIKDSEQRRKDTFESLDIPYGTLLTFKNDDSYTCVSRQGRMVLFEDKEMTIGKAAKIVLTKKAKRQTDVSGFLYWQYEGYDLVVHPATRKRTGMSTWKDLKQADR